MHRTRAGRALTLAAAAACLCLLPAASRAQEEERSILIRDLPIQERLRINVEAYAREAEASERFREAVAAERAGDWREAAALYEESGELQTATQRMGALSFFLAGRSHYFGDRLRPASRAWEEAGHRFLVFGDVVGAARSFLQAAVAAEEAGDRPRAVELAWMAHHLTESDLITERERSLIRRHLRVTRDVTEDESGGSGPSG